jgi:hypothetical protein
VTRLAWTLLAAAIVGMMGCGDDRRAALPASGGGPGEGGEAGGAGSGAGGGDDQGAGGAAGAGGPAVSPGIGGAGGEAGGGASAAGAGGGGTGGAPAVSPEIDGRVLINELMARNALTIKPDGAAVAAPWVELYNPTDQEIPLEGYALTDDLAAPGKGRIGAGVVLSAQGRIVLWMDNAPASGPTHLAATLGKDGGVVGLARPDGTFIDRIAYGAQEVDLSAAREPDGSNAWVIEWHASPAAPNPAGAGQPFGPQAASDPPEAVPAAGDPTEVILGYDRMPAFALTITPDNVAALKADPRSYVPATLSYDGRDYGPVGVKLKGMMSFQPIDAKPSLHVNVDKYVDGAAFFGLKDLTLNNMAQDFSMMHERLAYWAARQVGVPASRANHALVTVNGTFYGLYANVETVKKRLMKRLFGDDSGALFSALDVDFAPQYVASYTLESGPDDRTLISGLADALAISDPDMAMVAAARYADLDEFVQYWALCAVVGQFDAFPYSNPGDDYYLYADPTTGRLTFLPWGIDESFYSSDVAVTTTVHSVMALQCEASPGCFQQFVNQTWAVLGKLEQLGWEAERARVAAQIASYAAMDTRKMYSDDDVAKYQQAMHYFVSERRSTLSTKLPAPTP